MEQHQVEQQVWPGTIYWATPSGTAFGTWRSIAWATSSSTACGGTAVHEKNFGKWSKGIRGRKFHSCSAHHTIWRCATAVAHAPYTDNIPYGRPHIVLCAASYYFGALNLHMLQILSIEILHNALHPAVTSMARSLHDISNLWEKKCNIWEMKYYLCFGWAIHSVQCSPSLWFQKGR